jgi:hypothetical protein
MSSFLRVSLAAIALLAAAPPSRSEDAVPSDVASVRSIVAAAYEIISGPADKARDWDRFRALFRPDGRLIPVGAATDPPHVTVMSAEDYAARAAKNFSKNGFFEKGVSENIVQFGHIAHVFSTYESRRDPSDAKPFARGINSFQLIYDGHRWWIESLLWQAETATEKIPAKFLHGSK